MSLPIETARTRRRYDRIAPMYDYLQGILEFPIRHHRRQMWARVNSRNILEAGVGTGKNIPFHPPGAAVTAFDLSPNMLTRARRQARAHQSHVRLQIADVQHLPYLDRQFDVAVATFVFFIVADPIAGLREVRRVLKPGGKLFLLEHVVSEWRVVRSLMKRLTPLGERLWSAHLDRDTVANVRAAGFTVVRVENLAFDIIRRIEAHAPP